VKTPGAFAIAQGGHCGWSDVTMLRSIRHVFERISHTHEPGVLPGASEQLNTDRLPMIVEAG
jgi:hypothetical protein